MKLTLALKADHIVLTKDKFKKLDNNLEQSKLIYRYIPREHWHIKLLTLSEVKEEDLPALRKKIEMIIRHHRQFDLKLNGLNAYPNLEEGRLLWIGVQNSIALRSLQSDIAKAILPEKDIWEEKTFKPTLPVLRFKNHHNVTDMISPYKGSDFGKITLSRMALYEMISSGAFPQYKIIDEFNLPEKETAPFAGAV